MAGRKHAAPPFHEADVLRDAEHPGPYSLGFVKLVQAFKHFQKRVLGNLLCILSVAAHQPTVMENFRAEILDEMGKRFRLSGEEPTRQLFIVLAYLRAHSLQFYLSGGC